MAREVRNLGIGFGDSGQRHLQNTESSAVDEYFCAFTALKASVVSYTLESANGGGDASQTGLQVDPGITIYGCMTNIVMTSGEIMAYLAQ